MTRCLSFLALVSFTTALLRGATVTTASLSEPASAADSKFATSASAQIASKMKPEAKDMAERIYRELAPAHSPAEIGNAAVGLWMVGRLQIALHVMGKALAADPGNIDNQSNYAAMLTMTGGSKLALPTLEKLARQFPNNSTVLNNLGQAYYLAGQEKEAEKPLTRALAVAGAHPQAAATLSQIASGQGDNARAVALAKQAVQRSLSQDKLNDLRKLRYKLTLDDLKDLRPTDPDPLGLKNFVHPEFPRDAVEEYRARREWKAFYDEIDSRSRALHTQLNTLRAPLQAAAIAQAQAVLGQSRSGKPPAVAAPSDTAVHPRARRAQLMLELLNKDSAAKARLKRAKDALQSHVTRMAQMVETDYAADFRKLDREQGRQVGEGLANQDFCDRFTALADRYLAKWSEDRARLYDDYLREVRLQLSEEIYWKQFLQPRDQFRVTVLEAQIEWLGAYSTAGIRNDGSMGIQVAAECLRQKPAPRGVRLTNFNDVHCEYHSELNLVFGSIASDCDKMVSTLGFGGVKFSMQQDMERGADFHDNFVQCNIEISAGKSIGVGAGPLSVEAGAEAGLGVEIGRNGVQDVYVTGKAGASAMNTSSGVEGRMSLMSGSSSVNVF